MSQPPGELIARTCVSDLRSELEAQLRALSRIEEALGKCDGATGAYTQSLLDVVCEDLDAMIQNNSTIHDLLTELASELAVDSYT